VWRLRSPDLAGRIRLGSNEEIDPTRMADLLGRFKRSHPDTTIEFVIDSSVQLRRQLDRADIDMALIQVTAADLRPTDSVLWTDSLHWVTARDWTHDDGPVPLVTFGTDCFYQTLSEPLLRAAGIDSSVAFSASSTRGVRAAVAAGLGVAVMSSWHLADGEDDIVEWPRGERLPRLPDVHQVARTVPGEAEEVAAALVEVFSEPLDDSSTLVTT
jgi:DNA-binding transcriptional LysR family regulator